MSHHRQEEHAILRESDAKDWFYKGEGAANLVLGYSGSSPSLVGKVLRIQKSAKQINVSENGCLVLSEDERLIWEDVGELVKSTSKEAAARAFVQCVMTNYLDSKHIDPGIPIPVSKEFLEAVEMNINSQRPAWRVAASNIDKLCGSALLISDHSIISGAPKSDFCFAVEIKPKCGFLPSSEYIAEATSIKKHVTRFKMHQFLKLHQGENCRRSFKTTLNNILFSTAKQFGLSINSKQIVSQVSGYDPLDLFSGSRDRMLLAITALFTSPQNNFRIFMNGSLIYGGLGGGIDSNSVLSPKTENAIADLIAASGLQLVSFLELIAEILFRSGILHRLLATQKMDILDIEGAIHLYYNIISQPCSVCKNLSKAEVLHKYSSLHSLPLEKSLKIVRDYLIAATAKDCSLMISLRPSEDGHSASNHDTVFSKSSNRSYDYKAYYIDLDLKPLKKMVYYYQLDQKIVNFYKMNQEIQGKACCPGNVAPTAKY